MSQAPRLEYQPALDGVRAMAVIAVVLFHAGVPGFEGGYLGVSVFFTLSGYLITSLLLAEHNASGSIALGTFYGRRLRRLVPASIATVAAVVVIDVVFQTFDAVVALRAQVVGALLQVSNWVLLAGGTSYQDLLAQGSGSVSPLEHFWSLAIEEQFYWLWPPLLMLMLTRVSSPRVRLRVVGFVTVVAMLASPIIAQVWGPDAAYWATPARLGEILVGAFLAFVLNGARLPRHISIVAPIALATLALCVVTFPASSGPAYAGLLPLVAVVSGGLIVGLQADGPLRRTLARRPVVAIGLLSYGIYLVHWPIFVIVDAERTGLDGPALTAIRLLLTALVAIASYFLIERPIRRQQHAPVRITVGASLLASLVVIVGAVIAMPSGPSNYWNLDEATSEAAAIDTTPGPAALTSPSETATTAPTDTARTDTATTTTVVADAASTVRPAVTADQTATTPPPLPALARPIRIVVTGDSTAAALGTGVVSWAAANPDIAQAEVDAALGCGFVMGGERLWGDEVISTECDGWTDDQLYPTIERTSPDIVVVMTSGWDVIDQRWDGGELLGPSDPEYRGRLVAAYSQLVDEATSAGAARVVFVRGPVPNAWWEGDERDESDPARHQVLFEVYDETAASHPETVRVIDLASWFSANALDDDQGARPDGVHLAPDSATSVVDRFLGPELVRAAIG